MGTYYVSLSSPWVAHSLWSMLAPGYADRGRAATVLPQSVAHVLDVAVAQINQHTELRIAYQLHKKGRAFEEISFTVEMQEPQQLPSPFEDTMDPDRAETARQRLLELQILAPRLTA